MVDRGLIQWRTKACRDHGWNLFLITVLQKKSVISSYQQFPTFFCFIVPFSIYICIVNICLFSFLESLRCTFPKRPRIKGSDQQSFSRVTVGESFPGGKRKWCRMKRKLVHQFKCKYFCIIVYLEGKTQEFMNMIYGWIIETRTEDDLIQYQEFGNRLWLVVLYSPIYVLHFQTSIFLLPPMLLLMLLIKIDKAM